MYNHKTTLSDLMGLQAEYEWLLSDYESTRRERKKVYTQTRDILFKALKQRYWKPYEVMKVLANMKEDAVLIREIRYRANNSVRNN